MIQSYPLKNLPAPLQTLIRPMLLISLAAHGLLLSIPLPSNVKPVPPPKEKPVRITQLSNSPKQPIVTLPKASPKIIQLSKLIQKVALSNRQLVLPYPRPRVVPPQLQTALQRPIPTPSVRPSTVSSATTAPSPTPSNSPSNPNNPFADFPHYQPSTPGCFNLPSCYQTNVALDGLAAYFDKQLPVKYAVKPGVSEPNRKVYQLSKGGVTKYLNLILIDQQQGTAYVLADQAMTPDQLKKAVEPPPELYDILSKVSDDKAEESDFADTRSFFTQLTHQDKDGSVLPPDYRPGIEGDPKLVTGQTPQAVATALTANLQSVFDKVTPAQDYGGGPVYQMTKGNFTAYLNLVPTQDGKSTIVVLWTSPPQ